MNTFFLSLTLAIFHGSTCWHTKKMGQAKRFETIQDACAESHTGDTNYIVQMTWDSEAQKFVPSVLKCSPVTHYRAEVDE